MDTGMLELSFHTREGMGYNLSKLSLYRRCRCQSPVIERIRKRRADKRYDRGPHRHTVECIEQSDRAQPRTGLRLRTRGRKSVRIMGPVVLRTS